MVNDRYYLKKQPLQQRSKFMVDTIKEAATHILRENGCQGLTTNRVAERAGVSIGSFYQYFPSKESVIAEVKRDHFTQLRELMDAAYQRHRNAPLETIVRAFIQASLKAHQLDPELHKVLSGDLSEFQIKEDDDTDASVRHRIEGLLQQHRQSLRNNIDIPLAAKLTYKVVETVTHDAVLNHSQLLDDERLVDEVTLMVMAYLVG